MSAARTLYIVGFLAALLVVAALVGCDFLEPDRSGNPVENVRPEVFVVNVPPDSAQFSRNPDLNWYATDIDGYITSFRYSVVVESMMVINGNQVTPDVFIEQATDEQFGWTTLPVNLDNPQSMATVRLYANRDFPVDSFVSQFFFIQAEDDRNGMSDIKYRKYSRNNHYPNTKFRPNKYYINAKDAGSPAPGIGLTWLGSDSVDWGRADPPLEYEWRLYGPFDTLSPIYVKIVKENCIYDPTVDSLIGCINVPVLDIENLPEAVGGAAQPIMSSQGPNFANDSNDVWVTDNQVNLYGVFDELVPPLSETSKYKFIFWVRARDDAFVPDPTPAFGQFNVFEALFERPIAIFDETGYTTTNGRWGPESLYVVMDYWEQLIRNAGYSEEEFSKDYSDRLDYFFSTDNPCDSRAPYRCRGFDTNVDSIFRRQNPNLIDVLSHRILILLNDDVDGELSESPLFGFLDIIYQGMDMGASGLIMARNLGEANQDSYRNEPDFKSIPFQRRFGISQVNKEAWFSILVENLAHPVFAEEFIGAYPNIGGYPQIDVDYGHVDSRINAYYRFWPIDPDHIFEGSPEIGVATRTQFAAPLYLYLSKDGAQSVFHGKVNAVAMQDGELRSACFLFTPLAMDQEPMQEVFTTIIQWLEAKFTGGATAMKIPTYNTGYASIAERRARLQQMADYISEHATQEQIEKLGLALPPYQISPE